jgi:hypothetical protein
MEPGSTEFDREVRAARNQSLFRAANESIKLLNEAFSEILHTFEIACECANEDCVQMIVIAPVDYTTVRRNPRRFVILPEHVDPEVERVVSRADAYVVVEKFAAAAIVAEQTAQLLDDGLSPQRPRRR